MNTASFPPPCPQGPPAEYEAAMDDIEARAARGELTGAQARQKIHALRERFAVDAGIVTQWAIQARGTTLGALLATSLQASGIAPRVSDTFAPLLSQACARFDICTPARVAAFVAQCAFESRGFVTLEEGMLYRTPEHISATWPERVPDPAHGERLVGAPQLLADTVYSGCWGNGDAASGDGWRYRGRGLIRLLGRATYREAGAALGRPYEQQPELVARTQDACLTAAWLWHNRGLNALADRLEIDAIARHARDPRSNALPERRALYRGALAAVRKRPGQVHAP